MIPSRRTALVLLALALAAPQARADSGVAMPYIPYVPSPQKLVERMLEIAEVGPDDYVIDLGSGDGRISIAAARRGARGFGVDIDEKLVEHARENAERAGVADRVEFRVQDLFKTEVSKATVLTLYLPSFVNEQLRPRLLKELKPGTRIVAHEFGLGEWRPDIRERFEHRHILFWRVPARVEGLWQVRAGDTHFTLELEQRFQEIRGVAVDNTHVWRLNGPRLDGTDIEFVLDLGEGPVTFRGRVDGKRMVPRDGNEAGDWHAEYKGQVPVGMP